MSTGKPFYAQAIYTQAGILRSLLSFIFNRYFRRKENNGRGVVFCLVVPPQNPLLTHHHLLSVFFILKI